MLVNKHVFGSAAKSCTDSDQVGVSTIAVRNIIEAWRIQFNYRVHSRNYIGELEHTI
jgi:hypothetical protein